MFFSKKESQQIKCLTSALLYLLVEHTQVFRDSNGFFKLMHNMHRIKHAKCEICLKMEI